MDNPQTLRKMVDPDRFSHTVRFDLTLGKYRIYYDDHPVPDVEYTNLMDACDEAYRRNTADALYAKTF